jgi:molybdopterin converting factor small subunit
MEVTVRLHGILRDRLPSEAKGRTTLNLSEDARISDALDYLALAGHLQVACNDIVTDDLALPLHDGDTIEVFLPVAGG